jgi:hypothetical protein
MKRILPCVLAALAAVGCASSRGAGRGLSSEGIVVQGPADEARLWNAALDVVGARFAIGSAEETSGRIETDYLIGPLSETGFKSNTVKGGDHAYDSLHTIRRRAIVIVRPRDAAAITVEVERERCVRPGYQEPLPPGVYAIDTAKGPQDRNVQIRWVNEGRDTPIEEVITREIAERYGALVRQSRRP